VYNVADLPAVHNCGGDLKCRIMKKINNFITDEKKITIGDF